MIRRLTPLGLLTLAACMAGTPPPKNVTPPSASGPFTPAAGTSIDPLPDDWWRLYDDPQLDRLVTNALAANADLRAAFANLEAARATSRQAQAQRLPQMGAESGLAVDGTKDQPSASGVPSTDWDIGGTISWEIDLFGRLRGAALAARADAQAVEAARDAVAVAVVADTVQAWVDLCGTTRAILSARAIADAQDRTVAATRSQLQAGEVSPLEVSQVAALAATSRAAVPPLEAQRSAAQFRLATLQGRPPAEAKNMRLDCKAIPQLRSPLPVGEGTALLLRRPDLREAERKLAAETARIDVARADLYPRINFGGAIGLVTGAFDAVVSPRVTWAFPNQGPARAKLAQARARESGALAGWDVAMLKALREVETALADYRAEMQRNRDSAAGLTQAQAYARRADARVRLGDAPGLLRLDAERTVASAQLAQAQSDLSVAQAQVTLFRALGGGWRTPGDPR